jgi:hypothetical protein
VSQAEAVLLAVEQTQDAHLADIEGWLDALDKIPPTDGGDSILSRLIFMSCLTHDMARLFCGIKHGVTLNPNLDPPGVMTTATDGFLVRGATSPNTCFELVLDWSEPCDEPGYIPCLSQTK